jgi:hypothetical protein
MGQTEFCFISLDHPESAKVGLRFLRLFKRICGDEQQTAALLGGNRN